MRRWIAHDKGPLRPAQLAVLKEWFAKHQETRDIIVKLHTGQGKTLIGLLMLQARLNAGHGPALYLCPDNFLIAQTCEQARQFGIFTCTAEPDLPDEFLNGDKILVASVQKLFNGLTRFSLNKSSIAIETLLMVVSGATWVDRRGHRPARASYAVSSAGGYAQRDARRWSPRVVRSFPLSQHPSGNCLHAVLAHLPNRDCGAISKLSC
jgi:hypothetical protein